MKIAIRIAAVAAGLAALSSATQGDTLFDTGPGGSSSIGASTLFDSSSTDGFNQYLAGKFTLAQSTVVDELGGWMTRNAPGGLKVSLYSDTNALPGTAIYSKTYDVSGAIAAGWRTFGGYNASLPAGTYWAAFEPLNGGFSGTMPGGAPNPLPKTAFYANGNDRWVNLGASLGLRGYGRTATVLMGTAASGTYREDLPINGNPNGLSGSEGGNGKLTSNVAVGGSGGRGSVANGGLEAGAVASGFTTAPNPVAVHSGVGTGRGIAYRPFVNTSGTTQTLSINAILDGGLSNSFGTLNGEVDTRIAVLNPTALAAAAASRSMDVSDYLLSLHTAAGAYAAFDAGVAVQDTKSFNAFVGDDSGFQPHNLALTSGTFTLAAGQEFVLLFDVYARASAPASGGGSGTVDYLNTLKPAANLFTDANGAALTTIVAGQTSVPEPAFLAVAAIGLLPLRRRRAAPVTPLLSAAMKH